MVKFKFYCTQYTTWLEAHEHTIEKPCLKLQERYIGRPIVFISFFFITEIYTGVPARWGEEHLSKRNKTKHLTLCVGFVNGTTASTTLKWAIKHASYALHSCISHLYETDEFLLFILKFLQNAHKRVIIIIDLYCNKTIYIWMHLCCVLSGRRSACSSTSSQTIHNSSQHKYINKCKYMPSRFKFIRIKWEYI